MKQNVTPEHAMHALATNKKGVVCIYRDDSNKLWCRHSSGQCFPVGYLRLRIADQYFDEHTFTQVLLMRRHKEDNHVWFIMTDTEVQKEVLSSNQPCEMRCIALMVPPKSWTRSDLLIALKAIYSPQGSSFAMVHDDFWPQLLYCEGEQMMELSSSLAESPRGDYLGMEKNLT